MTVATTSTFEFSIDQIVRHAYFLASLANDYQTVPDAQMARGRTALEIILKSGQTEGLFARKIEFYTLTPLVATTYKYTLPANIFDTVGDGMYIDPSNTDLERATSETPVVLKTREEWHRLSAKSTATRPTSYFPHRTGAQVQVWIWPIPSTSEAGGAIRFQTHQLRADSTGGASTPDVERYWTDFLSHRLAHDLALGGGISVQRLGYIRSLYEDKMKRCKAFSTQGAHQQAVLSHPTGWSR